jgi:hypothetical protein
VSSRQIRVSILQLYISVPVTQLAAHTCVATFIGLILFHGPFASILVPRFVYGNNLNALDHTMSQFFMCHCILSDQATQNCDNCELH